MQTACYKLLHLLYEAVFHQIYWLISNQPNNLHLQWNMVRCHINVSVKDGLNTQRWSHKIVTAEKFLLPSASGRRQSRGSPMT